MIQFNKNKIPKEGAEYIYMNNSAWHIDSGEMFAFNKGSIVVDVEKLKDDSYEFTCKSSGQRYRTRYGWSFIENTKENFDLIKKVDQQKLLLSDLESRLRSNTLEKDPEPNHRDKVEYMAKSNDRWYDFSKIAPKTSYYDNEGNYIEDNSWAGQYLCVVKRVVEEDEGLNEVGDVKISVEVCYYNDLENTFQGSDRDEWVNVLRWKPIPPDTEDTLVTEIIDD